MNAYFGITGNLCTDQVYRLVRILCLIITVAKSHIQNQRNVNKIDIDKETLVIEIGPGVGALTQCLLEKVKKVICYEIDETLIPILKEVFKEYDSLEVINKDFLKVDLEKEVDLTSYKKVVVASNLPYYITSEILIKLFVMDYPFSIAAMMQKEVAKRIIKSNGGKDENELTLCSKYFTTYKLIKEVSKNDFFPKPNVDSSVLLFTQQIYTNLADNVKLVFHSFQEQYLGKKSCNNHF